MAITLSSPRISPWQIFALLLFALAAMVHMPLAFLAIMLDRSDRASFMTGSLDTQPVASAHVTKCPL